GDFTRLGIDPRDLVVGHSTRPRIPVLVQNRIIGVSPCGGDCPLLKLLSLGIEHPNLVATKFGKPETVLRIHMAPSRTGVWGGSRKRSGFHGLVIHSRYELTVEVHAIEIVF